MKPLSHPHFFLRVAETCSILSLLTSGEVNPSFGLIWALCLTIGIILKKKNVSVPPFLLLTLQVLLLPIGYEIFRHTRWHPVIIAAHLTILAQSFLYLHSATKNTNSLRLVLAFVGAVISANLSPEIHTGLFVLSIVVCTALQRFQDTLTGEGSVPKIWGATLALLLIVSGFVIFPLIPRPRLYSHLYSGGQFATTGLSGEIRLENIQRWNNLDDTIALRLYLPEPQEVPASQLIPGGFIRAKTLEIFDGTNWMERLSYKDYQEPTQHTPEDYWQINLIMDPSSKKFLPVPYGTTAVAAKDNTKNLDWRKINRTHDFETLTPIRQRLGYTALIPKMKPLKQNLSVKASTEDIGHGKNLIDVPKSIKNDPRFKSILQSLTLEKASPSLAASQIENYFRNGSFKWTLGGNKSGLSGSELLLQFLYQDKKGHCELFASAATLLLRELNIPARIVTGYRIHLKKARIQTARENDAHAWVEFFDNGSWNVLDPTPTTPSDQSFAWISNIWDEFESEINAYWYEKIVNVEEVQNESFDYSKTLNFRNDVRFSFLSSLRELKNSVKWEWNYLVYVLVLGLIWYFKPRIRGSSYEKTLMNVDPLKTPKHLKKGRKFILKTMHKTNCPQLGDLHDYFTKNNYEHSLRFLEAYLQTRFSNNPVAKGDELDELLEMAKTEVQDTL